jgi:hypothetical protein
VIIVVLKVGELNLKWVNLKAPVSSGSGSLV